MKAYFVWRILIATIMLRCTDIVNKKGILPVAFQHMDSTMKQKLYSSYMDLRNAFLSSQKKNTLVTGLSYQTVFDSLYKSLNVVLDCKAAKEKLTLQNTRRLFKYNCLFNAAEIKKNLADPLKSKAPWLHTKTNELSFNRFDNCFKNLIAGFPGSATDTDITKSLKFKNEIDKIASLVNLIKYLHRVLAKISHIKEVNLLSFDRLLHQIYDAPHANQQLTKQFVKTVQESFSDVMKAYSDKKVSLSYAENSPLSTAKTNIEAAMRGYMAGKSTQEKNYVSYRIDLRVHLLTDKIRIIVFMGRLISENTTLKQTDFEVLTEKLQNYVVNLLLFSFLESIEYSKFETSYNRKNAVPSPFDPTVSKFLQSIAKDLVGDGLRKLIVPEDKIFTDFLRLEVDPSTKGVLTKAGSYVLDISNNLYDKVYDKTVNRVLKLIGRGSQDNAQKGKSSNPDDIQEINKKLLKEEKEACEKFLSEREDEFSDDKEYNEAKSDLFFKKSYYALLQDVDLLERVRECQNGVKIVYSEPDIPNLNMKCFLAVDLILRTLLSVSPESNIPRQIEVSGNKISIPIAEEFERIRNDKEAFARLCNPTVLIYWVNRLLDGFGIDFDKNDKKQKLLYTLIKNADTLHKSIFERSGIDVKTFKKVPNAQLPGNFTDALKAYSESQKDLSNNEKLQTFLKATISALLFLNFILFYYLSKIENCTFGKLISKIFSNKLRLKSESEEEEPEIEHE